MVAELDSQLYFELPVEMASSKLELDVDGALMVACMVPIQPSPDAKHHFIIGAQLLCKSRSTKDRKLSVKLAKSAAEEADKSIKLDPNDATSHVLRALALDAQGYSTSALDVALSPLTAKSLSDAERGEALFKRAEIKKLSNKDRIDSAFEDLVESVRLYGENATAFRLLGEC
ncbi:uncharacterized protein LOC143607355 [Bidens hawaiensis]|uniref:uncharacterized protein LOC143607355 n=1 Tax=Bidens hawaiensis TaxID=980011 RepID=UPI004049C96F